MIIYKVGNIIDSEAEALVNTVNTVGVMGKGVALQFKRAFPLNYKNYIKSCKNNTFDIGNLLIFKENNLKGEKIIINFPTKKDWRKPSEYEYIEKGLEKLREYIIEAKIHSIALPPLGSGNGGLDWGKVKQIINRYLEDLDCDIVVFEPNNQIQEQMKKERVKLTPARAMLLSVLFDLVHNDEFISEFSAVKVAYFLQRFGAKDSLKLQFKPYIYGPYSNSVKHLLYSLNGSYIMGYSSMDKKAFDHLAPIMDTEEVINTYLNKGENKEYLDITNKTKEFFNGYYSNFSLELLSSVDYLRTTENKQDEQAIKEALLNWNKRKGELFSNEKYINIAIEHLNQFSNNMRD
jgi:O-acetyl-ADP-ribose deacetylase (regulator of RNase III)